MGSTNLLNFLRQRVTGLRYRAIDRNDARKLYDPRKVRYGAERLSL